MQSIAASIAVGFALSLLVFGVIGWISIAIVGAVIAPGSRFPRLPRILVLIAAWFLALPICIAIIEHTPLADMVWGHAGELLALPYLLCSPVLFWLFIRHIS